MQPINTPEARGAPHSLQRSGPPKDGAKPFRPPIPITQRKRRSKAVLPPLAWAAGWARKPDEPEPPSTLEASRARAPS
jgi:hypothetical protein